MLVGLCLDNDWGFNAKLQRFSSKGAKLKQKHAKHFG